MRSIKKILPRSEVFERILVRILVKDYGEEGKSKIKILTENALEYLASGDDLRMDRIVDARIFGAVRAENKSKNLFFAES